ncbi:WD40-repeat-containing domain protein [Favolaschia claudopus]|uniref:WD40-repeat-containing domain protein n=1 Tax=Favolaschia claudopus TaxID=2862362 RepID=A0AAW0A003_9AGAR
MATNRTTTAFQHIKEISGHLDSINAIEFSSDGKLLASGGDDGQLLIISAQNWKVIKTYDAGESIRAIAWHPLQSIVTFGTKKGIVFRIRETSDKQFDKDVAGVIHCMAYSSNGNHFAVGFNNNVLIARQSTMSTWSLEKYVPRPDGSSSDTDQVRNVHFHGEQSNILLALYLESGIHAYEFNNNDVYIKRQWKIDVQFQCGSSALSASSRFLPTTVLFQGVWWYDLSRKAVGPKHTVDSSEHEEEGMILPVLFIGPSTVAVGGLAGDVTLFELERTEAIQVLKHSEYPVQALV